MKTSSGVRTLEASGLSFLFSFSPVEHGGEAVSLLFPCSDLNESFFVFCFTKFAFAFADPPRGTVGVAFTIDPAHATEVRAYLGT